MTDTQKEYYINEYKDFLRREDLYDNVKELKIKQFAEFIEKEEIYIGEFANILNVKLSKAKSVARNFGFDEMTVNPYVVTTYIITVNRIVNDSFIIRMNKNEWRRI